MSIQFLNRAKPCACLKTRKEFIQLFKTVNEHKLENNLLKHSIQLNTLNSEIKKLNDKANAIIKELNL